jgi:phosphatidylinositol alpha-mannosyltransferase
MSESQKLKVGLVYDDSLDGNEGVAQYVKTVGAWLSSQGHEIRYLVGQTKIKDWHGGAIYSLATNKQVVFNGNRVSIPLPANKTRIKLILAEENFDLLHVMVPYSPALAARVINLAPENTAIVGTFHIYPSGFLSKAGSRVLRLFLARSLKKFLTIVSVSPAAADFAKKAYGLSTPIIPNVIYLSAFTSVRQTRKNKLTVLFLGRLVKRKGCRELILAFAELVKNLPQAELLIAGDGPDRQALEKLAEQLGLGKKIKFLGYINETDKPKLLAECDMACFPSLYGESFGIVLIEAMAACPGPVVGGDNEGYRTVLGNQAVLLIDPHKTRLFANRLEELLTDEPLRKRVSDWQQAEVKQYDVEVVGRDIFNVYKMAIARQTKKSHNNHHE